jgi:hypothetical protein
MQNARSGGGNFAGQLASLVRNESALALWKVRVSFFFFFFFF